MLAVPAARLIEKYIPLAKFGLFDVGCAAVTVCTPATATPVELIASRPSAFVQNLPEEPVTAVLTSKHAFVVTAPVCVANKNEDTVAVDCPYWLVVLRLQVGTAVATFVLAAVKQIRRDLVSELKYPPGI